MNILLCTKQQIKEQIRKKVKPFKYDLDELCILYINSIGQLEFCSFNKFTKGIPFLSTVLLLNAEEFLFMNLHELTNHVINTKDEISQLLFTLLGK